MKITYEKIEPLIKKNCFEFVFNFEHGDADHNDTYSVIFNEMNEEQMINYFIKSEEISQMIRDSRSSGKSLSNNFESLAKFDGFYIPLELDTYAKNYTSKYYADSGISEIFYHNKDGKKFKVILQN